MHNQEDHIEDLFKKHLKGDEMSLDGTEWSRLEAELHPKKKKRGFYWILLLMVGISGLLLAGLFTWSGDKELTQEKNSIEAEEVSSSKVSTLLDQSIKEEAPEVSQTNKTRVVLADKNPESIATIERENKDNVKEESVEAPLVGESPTPAPSENMTKHAVDSTTSVEVVDFTSWDMISLNSVKVIDLYSTVDLILRSPLETPMQPIKIRQDSSRNKAKPSYTINFTYRSMLNSGKHFSESNSKLLNYTQRNESSTVGNQYNVNLTRSVGNVELGAGINYYQINQNLGDPMLLNYQIYDSLPLYDSGGKIITYLNYNYRDTASTKGLANPKYNYAGISLRVGYAIRLTQKWSVTTSINANPSYLISAKGTTLSDALKPSSIDVSILNRFQLQGAANIGVTYDIDEKWKVSFQANLQGDAFDISKTKEMSTKFNNYGAGLSLHYRFK
ncbi:MAG: hypothetical protein ACPGTP_05485 [Bacteroidia bacterium]